MNKNGPIIVIEDDMDDQRILAEIFNELNHPNEIIFFTDGELALAYLQKSDVYPFLILSDINMPKLDGFALRDMIYTNNELSKKCIPYLFFSTAAEEKTVCKAYTMSVQGYFLKPVSYNELRGTIDTIISYWKRCYAPNQFE